MGRPKGSRNVKGTKPVMRGEYVALFRPEHPLAMRDHYVLVHRMLAYDAGWEVPPGHHVHHINGDKADNRLENLEVIEEGAHHRHHVAEAGVIENQHGVFPVLTDPIERRARQLEAWERHRANKRRATCPICGEPRAYDRKTCSRSCGYELRRRSA